MRRDKCAKDMPEQTAVQPNAEIIIPNNSKYAKKKVKIAVLLRIILYFFVIGFLAIVITITSLLMANPATSGFTRLGAAAILMFAIIVSGLVSVLIIEIEIRIRDSSKKRKVSSNPM